MPPPDAGHRRWVSLDGIFYQGDVWLDGAYLGDPEGYFFPHTFDISALSRLGDEHVAGDRGHLLADAQPSRPAQHHRVFQYWDGIDRTWNPGGLWRPVTSSTPARCTSTGSA